MRPLWRVGCLALAAFTLAASPSSSENAFLPGPQNDPYEDLDCAPGDLIFDSIYELSLADGGAPTPTQAVREFLEAHDITYPSIEELVETPDGVFALASSDSDGMLLAAELVVTAHGFGVARFFGCESVITSEGIPESRRP